MIGVLIALTRFVNPNAGIRVGDYKLLVDCFNTSTLAPSHQNFPCYYGINCSGANGDGIMLYNIAKDPEEKTDLAVEQPARVRQLLERMATYAKSPDQVPPTVFWPVTVHFVLELFIRTFYWNFSFDFFVGTFY
jgi:hypothetical protein